MLTGKVYSSVMLKSKQFFAIGTNIHLSRVARSAYLSLRRSCLLGLKLTIITYHFLGVLVDWKTCLFHRKLPPLMRFSALH
jgi:hypothetical protein